MTYIDDCFFARNHNKVKKIIKPLENNFKKADEADFSTYLGIYNYR